MSELKLASPPEAHYTVYKLTSPSGKVYIGCTGQRVKSRWKRRGTGYDKGIPIREAIDFYGWQNFQKEILCEKLTKEGAEKLEAWFIEYYDSMDPEKGYNRYTGGSRKGARASELTVERQREALLYRYASDPEFCRMYSERNLAYYRSHPEAKARIARQVSEYLHSPEGKAFVHSSRKPQPVRCVETGVVYPSQRAAERITGHHGIHKACNGTLQVCGGYHWENI